MGKIFTALGLMSGTSMDGVDASIISSIDGMQYDEKFNRYYEYDKGLYQKLCNLRDKIFTSKDLKKLSKEVKSLEKKGEVTLIDVRDIRELWRDGTIKGALHIPRGMLEFWLDPDSIYFKKGKLDLNKEMVLFCAGGLRSALAAKTLKDMGFEKVSHIDGGFGSIKQSKFKII